MNKKFLFCCVGLLALSLVSVLSSCGSSWKIEGNNMTIIKCDVDTIAPAGSYLMLPDTLR